MSTLKTGHTGSVTQVEFVDAHTVVAGTKHARDIATGTQKAFTKGGVSFIHIDKQAVGQYVVTKRGDLVLVHLTHGLKKKEPTVEINQAVAFFRAPAVVETLACAGDQIAVGCRNGEVLHMRAPLLVEQA